MTEMPRSAYYLLFPLIQPETRHGIFIMFNKKQREQLFTEEFQKQIKEYDPASSIMKIIKKKDSEINNLQRIYIKTFLQSLLIVEDKMGMAHSIEARTPICDNEMINLSLKTSMKNKLHNKTLKFLFKESMKNSLPKIFYQQPKRGFPTPLSLWLRKELKEYAYNLLLDERTIKRGIFNPKYVNKLLDKACSSKTDLLTDLVNSSRRWGLINIELWFRIFIDQDKKIIKELE
jgi:asparagine synthase (glutamine-hydrolysing)